MRRSINQINVSITTNRTCTLQCTHCYIAPHLFKDKTQMTEEVYRTIFDKIEQLKAIDRNLHEIEWEAIGGETTMMPFEWWERQLPWTLDRIQKINKGLKIPGSLNFLTNLIYTDSRYTGLFNKYGDHPAFALYTSWEPDTQRFGKRNQLFDRFYETLKSIKCRQKILDIILTKEIIAMGAEAILDLFVPAGITDFSMKMISPYGSGKAFFDPNMAEFHQMSDFFKDMHRLKPAHVTFTPQEEMLSSLMKETSFQCNGNFKYDLSIEPDGVCHFNANQTADEAALGFRRIVIDDPQWHYKICFENKVEENNKLTLTHPECDQCEYLTHCNAGWYHYKVHDPKVIDRYRKKDCSGYKQFWDFNKAILGNLVSDRSQHIHQQAIRSKMRRKPAVQSREYPLESSIAKRYRDYFNVIDKLDSVTVDQHTFFGKSMLERLWFYDDLGVSAQISTTALFADPDVDAIVEHVLSSNMPAVHLTESQIGHYLASSDSTFADRCRDFVGILQTQGAQGTEVFEMKSDLIVDARHEEVFRSLIRWVEAGNLYCMAPRSAPESARAYILSLIEHVQIESRWGNG